MKVELDLNIGRAPSSQGDPRETPVNCPFYDAVKCHTHSEQDVYCHYHETQRNDEAQLEVQFGQSLTLVLSIVAFTRLHRL